jgi:acyl-CoA thioester hydrolase
MSAPRKRATSKTAATTHARVETAATHAGAPAATTRVLACVPVPVRWGDLDAFNHVNNAAFLVYAQEARLEWLAGIGGNWFDENAMPVVAAARVNYRRQLAWPARIAVELAATRIGNSSVTIAHRIVAQDDPACLYADGDVVMVWIDPGSGKPVPLPEAIRAACD